ncbi:hypothetical protein [Sediminibacillus massiliensis]|uniref:hypothetical protein n=1 Tax=Sediminibacillus massiliensis TaxID=1926277 RepID=UPI00098857DD|nr:hypothetical protein [Sediminibacillus massiliensis]
MIKLTFKNFKWYVLYALFLFSLIFVIISVDYELEQHAESTFKILPRMLFAFLAYPLIGIAVGCLGLFREKQKSGRWKFNLGRFLSIGLPSFYFAYYPYLVYFSGPLKFLEIPNQHFNLLMVEGPAVIYIFQFILGYSLVTGFQKEKTSMFSVD